MRLLAAAAAIVLMSGGRAPAQAEGELDDTPPAARAFLARWAEKMADVRTLRVSFRQTKRLRVLRRPLESRGRAVLKGPRLRMAVFAADGTPETELLFVPGEVRILHRRLERPRLEVFAIAEGSPPPSAFPLFGGDIRALPLTYRVGLERDADDGRRCMLTLVPRAEGSELAEFRMTFQELEVVAVSQRTRRGDSVTMEIEAFEVNVPVEDHELELVAPAEAEVVRVS